jgi:hypothetical protein
VRGRGINDCPVAAITITRCGTARIMLATFLIAITPLPGDTAERRIQIVKQKPTTITDSNQIGIPSRKRTADFLSQL